MFFYDDKSKTIYIGLKKNLVVTTSRFINEFFHDNKYKTLTSFFNESGSHNVWVHTFSCDDKSKIIYKSLFILLDESGSHNFLVHTFFYDKQGKTFYFVLNK